jgi:HAD superfamily hydrolase (TIGR01509 family)
MASSRLACKSAAVIEAVAFDLDGTLIESERRWEAARREVTESSGGTWRDDAQPSMMGLSTPEWVCYMQRELGVPLDADEIRRRVLERIEASYRQQLPLVPGAGEAVRRLAERWPLAVASSSPHELIELVIEQAGLDDAFGAVVSSAQVAHGKPAPDVYLRACELLGSAPARTAAIEDSGPGVRSAAAAGMPVVLVPGTEFPPDGSVLDAADLVLDSIEALDVTAVEPLGA